MSANKYAIGVLVAIIIATIVPAVIFIRDYIPSSTDGPLYHEVHYAIAMQGVGEIRLYGRTRRGCASDQPIGIRMSGIRMSDGKYLEGTACGTTPRSITIVQMP